MEGKTIEALNGHFCKVCNNPKDKYLYYGGRVCTKCRAFFRRIISENK